MTLKDPHSGTEFELLANGTKRLALIVRGGTTNYLLFDADDTKLARCFLRTYKLFDEGRISARTAHARRGLLLGYTKEQIRFFLRRNEKEI